MSLVFGAGIATVLSIWLAVENLLERREKFNKERSINATCKRESPSEDEWRAFALSTSELANRR